jgi:predicted MFS family arabinose efflux permease
VTSLVVGVALGNAAAGAVVEFADWRTSFVCATAGAVTGALVLRLRRASLVPPPRAPLAQLTGAR